MPVRPHPDKRRNIPFATPNTVPDQTAAKTLKSDAFLTACSQQGVEPTKRQAARYNARQGRWASR